MLSVAAVRATLGEVLTEDVYAHTIPLAGRWADGVQAVIDEFALPWVVKRLGCRAEYWPRPVPPRNGGEAAAAEDEELDRYVHLFMLNRGILLTPFHNMALMAPQTTAEDVDRHTELLREAARTLVG
jgi:glutamate-1-semialdehyde 2,1-aminomutase